jgi:hypothetical protein
MGYTSDSTPVDYRHDADAGAESVSGASVDSADPGLSETWERDEVYFLESVTFLVSNTTQ